jgi:holo-[acyl-carrier protein] synthase
MTAAMVVGCDVVEVARIERFVARRASSLHRVFAPSELADAQRGGVAIDSRVAAARLAARFAAKEATRKALGGRGPWLTALEVRTDGSGQPSLWIDGAPSDLSCSLSHDAGVAMAVVVGTRAAADAALAAAGPGAPDDPVGT